MICPISVAGEIQNPPSQFARDSRLVEVVGVQEGTPQSTLPIVPHLEVLVIEIVELAKGSKGKTQEAQS